MTRPELREYRGGRPNDDRYASFVLRGPDLGPDEITRLTGLTPVELGQRYEASVRIAIHLRGAQGPLVQLPEAEA